MFTHTHTHERERERKKERERERESIHGSIHGDARKLSAWKHCIRSHRRAHIHRLTIVHTVFAHSIGTKATV